MIIVDGKIIAQKVLSQIKTRLDGRLVHVAAIWVGDNLAISHFVEMKKKYAESVGIKIDVYHFNNNAPEDKIINKIRELSNNPGIKGLIIELPLPEHLSRDKILNSISKTKDIDVLSVSAQEDFYNNRSNILPPAVEALKILFEEYQINPKEKIAAVFGQSILIGKPISHWLEQMEAKVLRINEYTSNTEELSHQAEIIISGVGKPNLIREDMIKDGAVIVDFGFEKLENKITGDIDFDSVAPKASLITPVPGGMGPIVIAAFLKNAVQEDLDSYKIL